MNSNDYGIAERLWVYINDSGYLSTTLGISQPFLGISAYLGLSTSLVTRPLSSRLSVCRELESAFVGACCAYGRGEDVLSVVGVRDWCSSLLAAFEDI